SRRMGGDSRRTARRSRHRCLCALCQDPGEIRPNLRPDQAGPRPADRRDQDAHPQHGPAAGVKPPYDRSYFPPAPISEISLAAPGERFAVGPLRALPDTGADACVIPARLIEPLGLQIDSEQYLTGLGGARRRVDIYIVDIGIGGLRLPGIEIAVDEEGDDI